MFQLLDSQNKRRRLNIDEDDSENPFFQEIQQYTDSSKQLFFHSDPCINPFIDDDGVEVSLIELKPKGVQANEQMKWAMIATVFKLSWC